MFHNIYGTNNLLALLLIFFVSLYRKIDDIKTIIVSIRAREGLLIVKKKNENN